MEQPDERALLGAAVRASRRVLARISDPAPRLNAALQRAEQVLEPFEHPLALQVELFGALPAQALPDSAPPIAASPARAAAHPEAPASPPVERSAPAGAERGPGTVRPAGLSLTPAAAGQPPTTAPSRPPVFSLRRVRAAAPTLPAPAPPPAARDAVIGATQLAGGREPAAVMPPATQRSTLAAQEPPQPASGAVIGAPFPATEPAGMALLRQLAAETLEAAPRNGAAVAPHAQARSTGGSLPAALPAQAYQRLQAPWEAAGARDSLAFGATVHEQAAPIQQAPPAELSAVPRMVAVTTLGAPGEAALAVEGFAQAEGPADAAQLARLLSDILVEQARRHGVELL